MNEEREEKYCRESRVIQTHRVFPQDLNMFESLFGGKLMTMLDDAASISVSRHCRRGAVTASVDRLNFLRPFSENHTVCVESYVSGVGKKSMEVFAKVLGENLATGERYLGATCFMTFVAVPSVMNQETEFKVPLVLPQTEEEKKVCEGYVERKQNRMKELKTNEQFASSLSLEIPWAEK